MKRKREKDKASYLETKINEYHELFHTLYSFIAFVPLDVVYYIAQYWYKLWDVPVEAFQAHLKYRLPPVKQKIMSVLIHTYFSDANPQEMFWKTLFVEFEDGRYRMSLAVNGRDYIEAKDPEERAQAQLYHTSRVSECAIAQYEGDIVLHVCIDNEAFAEKMNIMSNWLPVECVHGFKTDPLWRSNSSLMDLLFQVSEPMNYIGREHTIAFQDVKQYNCRVVLKEPYRLHYDKGKYQDEELFLYPLLICLKFYTDKHAIL